MAEKKEKQLSEDGLGKVTGGIDIQKEIKTLPGDNDPYTVAPSNKTQELIDKYKQDKSKQAGR